MTIEVVQTQAPTITISIDLDTAKRLRSIVDGQAKKCDDYSIVNMLDSVWRWVEACERYDGRYDV